MTIAVKPASSAMTVLRVAASAAPRAIAPAPASAASQASAGERSAGLGPSGKPCISPTAAMRTSSIVHGIHAFHRSGGASNSTMPLSSSVSTSSSAASRGPKAPAGAAIVYGSSPQPGMGSNASIARVQASRATRTVSPRVSTAVRALAPGSAAT